MFKDSALSLKPTVPSIHVINELKSRSSATIKLFSYIESDILSTIVSPSFISLTDSILSINQVINEESFGSDLSLIIFGSLCYLNDFEKLTLDSPNIKLINVQLPKVANESDPGVATYQSLDKIPFENYELPKLQPCYEGSLLRVELNKEIKTAELAFWKDTIAIEKIELQGRVVNGYKRGSKELGVPTANLEMCNDNIANIESLLPGVYCGTVQFLSAESNQDELIDRFGQGFLEKKYRTALSIGWNPSYDNSQRTIESYILEEFDNDFYGEELKIEITNYIRAESSYSSLDHLIMAIHNDIEATKHIVKID